MCMYFKIEIGVTQNPIMSMIFFSDFDCQSSFSWEEFGGKKIRGTGLISEK